VAAPFDAEGNFVQCDLQISLRRGVKPRRFSA
jgi:hypothetical protein